MMTVTKTDDNRLGTFTMEMATTQWLKTEDQTTKILHKFAMIGRKTAYNGDETRTYEDLSGLKWLSHLGDNAL